MAVITRQELQGNGKWWTWINYEGFNTFIVDTTNQISEADAVILKDKYIDDHLYDTTNQENISVYDNKQVIIDAVIFIKTTNPNLSQWNAYLSSLSWDNALLVRWFLATLALKLSERAEINLNEFTETEVLNKLKTWIINTSPRKINKVLFNE